ncbi:MAG: metal-dependent hydrolase [Pelotomaculum sp. PtaU1.Bin035]|nr:MAG: metal-dependent hydrolase [Pelotomaculum sp. PtaU1.Bin035]
MAHRVRWLGHAACQITTEKGAVILIDPWISGNPSCPIKKDDIKQADLILITHDHFDHLGTDVPDLVKSTGATVIVQPELADTLRKAGVSSDNIVHYGMGMNIGAEAEIAGVKVIMVQAFHSCAAGTPAGYIIILDDGKTIYHTGDTGVFDSMRLFGDIYNIDLALVPIGSVFTMNPLQAAVSLSLIKPKVAIPIHYRTFPVLTQDAAEFIDLSSKKAPEVKVEAIKPGQEVQI